MSSELRETGRNRESIQTAAGSRRVVTVGLLDQGGPKEKQVSARHECCPWSAPMSGSQNGPEQSLEILKEAHLNDAWERSCA